MGVVTYGLGTVVGVVFTLLLIYWFLQDITQKKHTVLRNFPVIGRLRYVLEKQGEKLRQYLYAGDRDEMPFNRATRGWVYRLAKDEGGMIDSARRSICASRGRSSSSMRRFRSWKRS